MILQESYLEFYPYLAEYQEYCYEKREKIISKIFYFKKDMINKISQTNNKVKLFSIFLFVCFRLPLLSEPSFDTCM